MKLTISKKNEQKHHNKINLVSQCSDINKIHSSPCCNIQSKGQKHQFLRPPKKEVKLLYDLIKIDCVCIYSKISSRVKNQDLQNTILETVSRLNMRYQPWLGYLCAHSCHNIANFAPRLQKIKQFIDKFRAIYEQKHCYNSVLQQTLLRLNKFCQDSKLKISQNALQNIARKFQQTLLLQFLPVQYSQYIIDRYLSVDGDIQQYVRLVTSLVHCVLNTGHPVNEDHLVEIMHRPYMGTVQWPIIIANRYMFEADIFNHPFFTGL